MSDEEEEKERMGINGAYEQWITLSLSRSVPAEQKTYLSAD